MMNLSPGDHLSALLYRQFFIVSACALETMVKLHSDRRKEAP